MKRLLALLAIVTAGLLWTGSASAANGDNLRTIVADTTGTACPSIGTGLAFDGTHLLLSCWYDNKIVEINPADGSQVGVHTISGASGFGALAWDNGRHVLWACKDFQNEVGMIDLTTNTFTSVFLSDGCTDGLAYDASDDTIWSSADVSPTTEHYTTTGVLLMQFSNVGKIGGCGNSGIAVGGPSLYLANNGCSQIYEVAKDFSTSTLFATFPARLEDLECDNVTFAPKGAIWSKDAYDNTLNAWEIPAGSCLFGGGASSLSLDPPNGDNATGTSHMVTATLTDQNGPVSGAHILFSVSGANTATGDGTTDANGQATFTYTGTNAGDDTITACYDKNNDNLCGDDEALATAKKHWHVANADISVTKTGPSLAQNDSDVTYSILVRNGGPADASNVVVKDPVPAGTTYVSSSAGCTQAAGVVTCTAGTLANGASTTFTITVHVNTASSSVSNTAKAGSDNPDPDTTNNTSTATTRVNHAPSCSNVVASGPSLWPPNHTMRGPFTVSGGTDPDGDPVLLTILSVWQDEPTNGLGDGDTGPNDATIAADGKSATLRAERSGLGDGRVYYFKVSGSDANGGTCTATVAAANVPHDTAHPAVGGGPLYKSN